jgi:hypothetical protein
MPQSCNPWARKKPLVSYIDERVDVSGYVLAVGSAVRW